MPSSWLEDGENQAWWLQEKADAADEARLQPRTNTAKLGLLTAPLMQQQHQHQHPNPYPGQDNPKPRHTGCYAPYTGFQSGNMRTNDIYDGAQTKTSQPHPQEYSPEVQGDEVSSSVDGQTRPSDIDSLFDDCASEEDVQGIMPWREPPKLKQISTGTGTGTQNATTASTSTCTSASTASPPTPPPSYLLPPPIPSSFSIPDSNHVPTSASDANASTDSNSSSLPHPSFGANLNAGVGAGESSHAHYRDEKHRSDLLAKLFAEQGWTEHDPPRLPLGEEYLRWEDDQLLLAKQRRDARLGSQPSSAMGFWDVVGGPTTVGRKEPEEFKSGDGSGRPSFDHGHQGDRVTGGDDAGFGLGGRGDDHDHARDNNYPRDGNQHGSSGGGDQDNSWAPPRFEPIDIASAPWAYLHNRCDHADDNACWSRADARIPPRSTPGSAESATQAKPTWVPTARALTEDEKGCGGLLSDDRLNREAQDPSAHETGRLADVDPDDRGDTEKEREWQDREIKARRRNLFFGEQFGMGGPHDSSLWSEEQRSDMMRKIDLEVEALVDERRRRKEEAEVQGKDRYNDQEHDDPTKGEDVEPCICACGGEASHCSCHPLYCPCQGCDHTDQAEQLRRDAEMKWGEREGDDEQTAKDHGACCGGPNMQKKCVCLPGLCGCAGGCEEHHVGQPGVKSTPEPPSSHSSLWPRIPESERLFKLEQKNVPGSDLACACPPGRCKCGKPLSAPEQSAQPRWNLPPPTFSGTAATWTSGQGNQAPHLGLSESKESDGPSVPSSAPPSSASGFLHPTATAATTTAHAEVSSSSRQSPVAPGRPDTPRPPADSDASFPYGADVLHEYVRQSREPEPMPPSQNDVRKSVEPEYPSSNWARDTTPAYEDRSFTPSPFSNHGDVEMRDASGGMIVPPRLRRDVSVPAPDLDAEEHGSESPQRRVPPPVPDSAIKQPKRGDRRKSGVQGSKVEKRSVTGSKAKPKSRNVTRKPTQSVGKLVQQAKKDGKEAGQEEGSFALETPRKPAPKLGGKVAEAVKNIERQVRQQEKQDLMQKDGTPVRRSARANKGVRTPTGYESPK